MRERLLRLRDRAHVQWLCTTMNKGQVFVLVRLTKYDVFSFSTEPCSTYQKHGFLRSSRLRSRWCEAGILKDLFPRIYDLETCKDVNIRTKLEASSLETSLRHNVRGGAEQAQLIAVSEVSGNITLAPQADRYNWLLYNDGVYSVASLKKKIDNQRSLSEASRTRWVKYIPIKVNILAWKIKLNALPTRFNLSRRGIDIGSLMCPLCDVGIETSTHLFFICNIADQIYYKIARWWNVTYEGFTSYTEWLGWLALLRHSIKLKALLEGVFYNTWWFLWGFRNKIMFDSNSPSKAVLFDNIVSSSFTWCRSRCKAAFTWNDWLKNPYLIIV
uniref:RNA-directed DNA polymerase, eukaryota n=1 Tax=Tanacetum cinerariifolium TaxID=118510 RepID=A0A6L2JVJ6_TANCI|nr:RNA-directed DNA polymerase, eukaryota [Tanacetum cinerariifolium]